MTSGSFSKRALKALIGPGDDRHISSAMASDARAALATGSRVPYDRVESTFSGEKELHALLTDLEHTLLNAFLAMSDNYVEFGTGGSTIMACQKVHRTVTSVDSSLEWIEKVKAECTLQATSLQPDIMHVDIGQIGGWGFPIDNEARLKWPKYHEELWSNPNASDADLYFVDGRFRVACFIQALLHSSPRSLILMHDFSDRPHYHVVRRFAREIATSQRLSAFQRLANPNYTEMISCLQEHRDNPE
jgi:hypothetical protein